MFPFVPIRGGGGGDIAFPERGVPDMLPVTHANNRMFTPGRQSLYPLAERIRRPPIRRWTPPDNAKTGRFGASCRTVVGG